MVFLAKIDVIDGCKKVGRRMAIAIIFNKPASLKRQVTIEQSQIEKTPLIPDQRHAKSRLCVLQALRIHCVQITINKNAARSK